MSQYLNRHCPVNPTMEFAESIEIPKGTTEIVSQGGGSTIDVGKWLARKYNLKHTVIPTTAGTGSEVTKYCVLTVDGVKTTFTDDKFIPDSYILNPELVKTCPREVTLSSGLDALSQALEAMWSKNATPESTFYAEMALNLIPRNLKQSLDNPDDLTARMNMLIAANFAGRAINITKTNVCHAISYPLTDLYGIPHGIACAMTLPYFTKKFLNADFLEYIKGLKVPEYGIDIEKIVNITIKNPKLKDCPVKVDKNDIIKSLEMWYN